MKIIKIKSYCKINLFLRVIRKLNNGYHQITSLITFCHLHDVISISKIQSSKDLITFTGKFSKGIDYKLNIVTQLLNLLRKNNFLNDQFYKISIKKNIPHGSGLGGGSSNAADLLNYFNIKMKLSKKKIIKLASEIGFDVPICLEKKNTFLSNKNNKISRIDQKFNLNLLIIYPNLICSTKKIYKKNKRFNLSKESSVFKTKNASNLIRYLKNENNDLEETAIKIYPKIKKVIHLIKSQKGCYFSRLTGSGSACIGIFSNKKNAIFTQKLIKLKYPKYWCVVSKTI